MKYELHLRTSRAGALAGLGHDLDLIAEHVEVTASGESIRAVVKADSVKVFGAMTDGRLDTKSPGPKDREKILGNIQKKVLQVAKFPEIIFDADISDIDSGKVSGMLHLCGVSRPLTLTKRDRVWTTRINQPDFGIEPYSALMGQLKVADDVIVVVEEKG